MNPQNTPNTIGQNTTSIPTATIQTNLGIKSDNNYGPQTTAAVKAFQSANGLVPDGVFGPKTQAVYSSKYGTGNSIVSTGDIHNQAKIDSAALTSALNMNNLPSSSNPLLKPTNDSALNNTNIDPITGAVVPGSTPVTANNPTADPFIDQLNQMSDRSNTSTKMLISNIVANKQNQEQAINKQFDNYKKGLQLLGIQSGAAESSPDLLMGHIQDVENQHMDKINALNSEEAKSLMDAENARADNNFKLFNESMTRYKEIQTAKSQALKDYNDALTNQPKVASIAAHDIYATMNTLDDADKEKFLQAVATKFNLPLASLTTALVDEKKKQDTENLKTENTKSIIEKRDTTGTTKTGVSTTFKSAPAIASVSSQMEAIKGKDNYIDPNKWIVARTNWNKAGGTDATFNSTFKKYLNPASYTMAGFPKPKSTTTKRSS